jgi:hypothetical protein
MVVCDLHGRHSQQTRAKHRCSRVHLLVQENDRLLSIVVLSISLIQPVFNLVANGEDSWSSSDGGNSEQEGEYTGKFRVVHVPTKVDPPTSGTRGRIESWGRPISPFPRRGSPILEIELDDAVDDTGDLDLSLVQPQFHVEEVGDRHVPEPPMDVREPASKIEVPQEPATATEISETEEISTSQELTHDNHSCLL